MSKNKYNTAFNANNERGAVTTSNLMFNRNSSSQTKTLEQSNQLIKTNITIVESQQEELFDDTSMSQLMESEDSRDKSMNIN